MNIDIWYEILLQSDINKITTLCRTNPDIYTLCHSVHFWEKIFDRDHLPLFKHEKHFTDWVTLYYYVKYIVDYVNNLNLSNYKILFLDIYKYPTYWLSIFAPDIKVDYFQVKIVINKTIDMYISPMIPHQFNDILIYEHLTVQEFKSLLVEMLYVVPSSHLEPPIHLLNRRIPIPKFEPLY